MTDSILLDRKFTETSYEQDDETFREFKIEKNGYIIEVSGIDTIEICEIETKNYISIPNCKTAKQLDQLLVMFNLK